MHRHQKKKRDDDDTDDDTDDDDTDDSNSVSNANSVVPLSVLWQDWTAVVGRRQDSSCRLLADAWLVPEPDTGSNNWARATTLDASRLGPVGSAPGVVAAALFVASCGCPCGCGCYGCLIDCYGLIDFDDGLVAPWPSAARPFAQLDPGLERVGSIVAR